MDELVEEWTDGREGECAVREQKASGGSRDARRTANMPTRPFRPAKRKKYTSKYFEVHSTEYNSGRSRDKKHTSI